MSVLLQLLSTLLVLIQIGISEPQVADGGFGVAPQNTNQDWSGSWFPFSPKSGKDPNQALDYGTHDLYDPKHGIVMGVEDSSCDDGQNDLEIDWDFNPINYTCFEDKSIYQSRSDVQPILSIDRIPPFYSAPHKCMKSAIVYNDVIPTYGTHRPLWAKYGEYIYLPRQRWVHNLEHGSVVMLYHPCADKNEVNLLRKLVKGCLYRHVITPLNILSPERPLALVSWGRRLEMSKVSPEIVINFIKENALKGPEKTTKDGQYDLMLKEHSEIVSDLKDHHLCKDFESYQ